MNYLKWDLKQLTCFVSVARELHFGRAAAKLGMSQPPLTQHIQALEHKIGAKLFERSKRHVALTPEGALLLKEAVDILNRAERIDHVLKGLRRGEHGHLTVGCTPTALFEIFPAIARRFRALHPQIQLVIREAHTSAVLGELLDRKIDVGFVWEGRPQAPIDGRVLVSGSFLAAMPEHLPIARKRSVTLQDLASYPIVLPPRSISPYHYDNTLGAFARAGLTPLIEYEMPTLLAQLGYVASGFGIALLPPFAQSFARESVVFRPIAKGAMPFALSFVWNTKNLMAGALKFRKVVDAVYPQQG
jgi:DNA-binding transcriptional LysR family regulator